MALAMGGKQSLFFVLLISLWLQAVVMVLAAAGSQRLRFARKGYWLRLGSSCVHLGLILFVLDLFLYRHLDLHLWLFWLTTAATMIGMLLCFFSTGMARLFRSQPAGGRTPSG
jgi:hypothetical protein